MLRIQHGKVVLKEGFYSRTQACEQGHLQSWGSERGEHDYTVPCVSETTEISEAVGKEQTTFCAALIFVFKS